MTKLARTLALGALGATLVFGTAACGGDDAQDKAAEEIIESSVGGDVDIDTDAGTVDVDTGDGSITSGRDELPEGWPEDVELPDDLAITFTSSTGDEATGITTTVVAEAEGDGQEVMDAIAAGLDGWEEGDTFDMSDGSGESTSASVGYEKDGRQLAIAVLGSDGINQVTVSHITAH